MRLINQTRDVELTDDLRKPNGLKEKTVGLLGEEDPGSLYFRARFGLHTLGMNFPIDCIVCDDNLVVRKLGKNIKPNRFFLWNPKYSHVIELPSGSIRETNTQVLDKLEIKE